MVAQKTREYEMIMILSSEATEEEVAAAVEMVTGLITDAGGEVTESETWGVRRLAFPVLKSQEGNYTQARFTMPPAAVPEFERALKASPEILRFLVTKV